MVVNKPRCHKRMAAFDQPDTCDPKCALVMVNIDNGNEACAYAVRALNEIYRNRYVIKNEVRA